MLLSNVTSLNETYQNVLIVYSDINVKGDQTVELNCEHFGRPIPNVVWNKNDKQLNMSDEKYRLDKSGSLKIVRTHPIDTGDYQCVVSNRYGHVSRSFKVNVETQILEVSRLSRGQIAWIVLISLASFILLIMLIVASVFAFYKNQAHANLVVSFN